MQTVAAKKREELTCKSDWHLQIQRRTISQTVIQSILVLGMLDSISRITEEKQSCQSSTIYQNQRERHKKNVKTTLTIRGHLLKPALGRKAADSQLQVQAKLFKDKEKHARKSQEYVEFFGFNRRKVQEIGNEKYG